MRLPLSGREVGYREPDGAVEAIIADLSLDRPIAACLHVLEHLAHAADGGAITPANLTLTDFETALVGLRCSLSGSDATSERRCPACGERIELGFSLEMLALAAASRAHRGADGGTVDGTAFRLPTAGDARAVEGHADAAERLLTACVDGKPGASLRRRIDRAITRLAPILSRVVAAPCAACQTTLRAVIHVPTFVLGELVWTARSVFDDVHVIASGYGWREADILALPRTRRRRYAANLRAGR